MDFSFFEVGFPISGACFFPIFFFNLLRWIWIIVLFYSVMLFGFCCGFHAIGEMSFQFNAFFDVCRSQSNCWKSKAWVRGRKLLSRSTEKKKKQRKKYWSLFTLLFQFLVCFSGFLWSGLGFEILWSIMVSLYLSKLYACSLLKFNSGWRMKQLVCIKSFWSHLKWTVHQVLRHSLEEDWSIPMRGRSLTLKVRCERVTLD